MTELSPVRPGVSGFPLVALSAALWGTDALFRRGLALELPATTVVAYEHLLLALVMSPILLRIRWRRLTMTDWWSLLLIGGGASALATGLFTASFRFEDPNAPLLLQKLQPLVAIVAARWILKERLKPRFVLYAATAILAAWLITFPDPFDVRVEALTAGALAAGAAALWAMGTVLGRRMSSRLTFVELTAARFGIGLPIAFAFSIAVSRGDARSLSIGSEDLAPLVLLALIPGMLALLLYYRGLRRTPASAATIAELAFPAAALTVNYFAFGATVSGTQLAGIVLLSATLVTLAYVGRADEKSVGITTPPLRTRTLT